MYKYIVTILTPTYNRGNCLKKLFDSLCMQTAQNFQWLIIDDGSSDNTETFFDKLPQHSFEVNYIKKENGGKHTALNHSHPYISGKYVLIVDSDDYILPEAIETIENDWKIYQDRDDIGSISYLRCNEHREPLTKFPPYDYYISDYIHYRMNKEIRGDQSETFRTEIFKKYSFPVYEQETFMSEGWLWRQIALEYKTVYRSVALYVCEYLEGGLTKSGRLLRMKSPLGMMENCKSFFSNHFRMKIQFKAMILYWIYGFCADWSIKKILVTSGRKCRMLIVAPLGIILFYHWKRVYCFS